MIEQQESITGEPVFILSASDPFCLMLLTHYRTLCADFGKEQECDFISDMMQSVRAWKAEQRETIEATS